MRSGKRANLSQSQRHIVFWPTLIANIHIDRDVSRGSQHLRDQCSKSEIFHHGERLLAKLCCRLERWLRKMRIRTPTARTVLLLSWSLLSVTSKSGHPTSAGKMWWLWSATATMNMTTFTVRRIWFWVENRCHFRNWFLEIHSNRSYPVKIQMLA